jgi:NADH-quinone oxidoreductase subunit A
VEHSPEINTVQTQYWFWYSRSMIHSSFYHLLIYTLISVVLIGVLLLGAWWLGAKRVSVEKQGPYESGVVPESSARLAWPVPFYLVAIFFIIFDVEAAFIFAWAVAWEPLGLKGLVQITVFITILAAGLAWLWLKGGLNWGPSREKNADFSQSLRKSSK